MALYRFRLPYEARLLWKIVGLQRRVFAALAQPDLTHGDISEDWLQQVWPTQNQDWIHRFTLGGQNSVLAPLRIIARAPLGTRQFLLTEFQRQNRIRPIFVAGGGGFALPPSDARGRRIFSALREFCSRCYYLLGHNNHAGWHGYSFGQETITKASYKEDCWSFNLQHRLCVCPYCDGQNNDPDLDHYYPISSFPLLACCPWNLIPVCSSCNDLAAKNQDPPLSVGPPVSCAEWLHPIFRPAGENIRIQINGPPSDPQATLHSTDPVENTQLANHYGMIKTLGTRWRREIRNCMEQLQLRVQQGLVSNLPWMQVIQNQLDDLVYYRGLEPNTLVGAAVCRAIQQRRQGYMDELWDNNPPELVDQ